MLRTRQYYENGRQWRLESGNDPQLEVQMGGTAIVPAHGVPSVGGSNPYILRQSQSFVATGSEMELAFVKVGPAGLDRTVLIDDVRVVYLTPPPVVTSYALALATVPPGSGTVEANPSSPTGQYLAGTPVTLTAKAASGYQFNGWSGALSGSANPVTVTMDGNKNVVANFTTQSTVSYQPGLLRQIYTNISGSAIWDLVSSPKFPNAPDLVDSVLTLESQYLPNDAGENYGQRLAGWLVPPLTGNYVFYLASDDAGQVFLSPDENPANGRLIVEETSWSPWRNWEGTAQNPQRASAPIALEAGKYYALEVLHKEGNGGDHVAVAWKLPGGLAPLNGSDPIGGTHLVYRLDLAGSMSFTLGLVNRPLGGGSVTLNPLPFGNGRYANGTAVTVTANPASGYKFSGWEGALSGAANPATLTVTGNGSVIARFETVLPPVALVNPSFEVDTFSVIPGYVRDNGPISGWVAEGGLGINPIAPFGADNNYFTDNGQIPEGRQAAFIQDGQLKQVVKGLAVGGTYRVDYYENGRLHADPGDPILEVRMGGAVILPAHGVPSVGGRSPYTAQMSRTFVATSSEMELAFLKMGPAVLDRTVLIDDVRVVYLIAAPVATSYSLALAIMPPGSGTVEASPSSPNGQYLAGTAVTLTATAASGYQFNGWVGALSGAANPATLTMDGNKIVTANFSSSPSRYLLSLGVSPSGSGSLSASPSPDADGKYAPGTEVTLTANPANGYKFARWEGALSGAANPATLTLNDNGAVTAKFETVLPPVALVNPSFELDTFTKIPGYVGDNGPITGWVAEGGLGINPIAPFAADNNYFTDNGQIPEGRQAAFIQDGQLKQVVKGLALGGTYRVDYYENGRSHGDPGDPTLEVRMGGTVILPAHGVPSVSGRSPYTPQMSQTFVATASQMELAFVKTGPAGLDRTVLIDDVRVICLAMPLRLFMALGKGNLTLTWDSAASGSTLETTASLTPPVQWTPVSGVVNNQVTVPIQGAARFYRVRQ